MIGISVIKELTRFLTIFSTQFLVLKFTLGIRLDEEEELKGCDLVDHNIEAMLIHSIGKTSSFGPAKVNPYGKDEKFEKGPQGNYPMGNMNTGMA